MNATEVIAMMLLRGGPMTGRELVERSDGALKRGSVYVILDWMEEREQVRSELCRDHPSLTELRLNIPVPLAPMRRYTLTDHGAAVYNARPRDVAVTPARLMLER